MFAAVCIFEVESTKYMVTVGNQTYLYNPAKCRFHRLIYASYYGRSAAETICSSIILLACARNEYIDESIVTNDIGSYVSIFGMTSILL
jgi:hypothetical protein